MQELHGDKVLALSWNLDHKDANQEPTEELRQAVLNKLEELNITCENVIASDPINEVLTRYEVFGLPATLVFGRDGELEKVFEGAFTYNNDVTPFVGALLQQGE